LGFISFLIVLSILVFIHELGHFTVARLLGVKVYVFSIGFGKKLISKQWKGTQWSFSLIPLGGYVKMKGQEDLNPALSNNDSDSYNVKTPFQRILILLAGPFANFLLAFVLYIAIGLLGNNHLSPTIGKVVENSPAFKSGLKANDTILKINDSEVKTEVDKNLKYVAGSNTNIKIKSAYNKIFSGFEDSVKLSIERNGVIEQIKVNRYDFNDFNYWNNLERIKAKSISDKIGYINMASVKGEDIEDIFESFDTKKTIIIDLRNYPAFIYSRFSRYLNSEKRDFSTIYSPDINYPSRFVLKDNLKTNSSKKAFKGKIILLVNEDSMSRSEFTAMAFQTADNVITVGNQTAGADGDVVVFEYLGGFRTAISGNGIEYPDGSESQRKGVKIDIEVKPTINGLKKEQDEILEKAIELASE